MAVKQAIKPVGDSSQETFVSLMFVVTKADGSWRLVINLMCLNQDSQRPLMQWRLDDQIGSQGRQPVCSAILPSQDVSGL